MTETSNGQLLEVKDLSVKFGRRAISAVDGVTFNLGRERLGIVGESGSGKSTTGRAIMQLLPKSAHISASRFLFEGRDLLKLGERGMRNLRGKDMALIMQDPRYSLNPVLPIGKQVAEAGRLHLSMTAKQAEKAAREMLERVQIPDVEQVMSLYPHQISGGMGQRVMISMMLLARPKLVIADEPTSALDVNVRRSVLELLQELTAETGSGLILISHDIRMVASFCDRVLVMFEGKVVEELKELAGATHPYTRALIAAMPDAHHPVKRLKTIDRAELARMIQ